VIETLSAKWRARAAKLDRDTSTPRSARYVQYGKADVLRLCADEYDRATNPDWLGELCSALGWQGGTAAQAIEAVKHLKYLSDNMEVE